LNKEIIDCIRAEKEKELQARKEKEEKIALIKEFFKDLPEEGGEYRVYLVDRIETKKRDHWYSKSWTYFKSVYKEYWCHDLNAEWVDISRSKIEKGSSHYGFNIDRWTDNQVNVFYEHLDWFEKELGREYCRKA
jgi:hypothetical protein